MNKQKRMTVDGGEFPNANDWKNDASDVISNTEASIDSARRHRWRQAKDRMERRSSFISNRFITVPSSPRFNKRGISLSALIDW